MPAASFVHYSNDFFFPLFYTLFSLSIFFSSSILSLSLFLFCPQNENIHIIIVERVLVCMFTFNSVHACIGEGKSMTDYHLRLQRNERKRLNRKLQTLNKLKKREREKLSYWNIKQYALTLVDKSLGFRDVYFIIVYLHNEIMQG